MLIALKVLAGLAALYAMIAIAALFGQRYLMYAPDTRRILPREADLPEVEERLIETPDGARVVAWYGRARPGQPTVLYFHGNAGSLVTRSERIRKYLERGRGMLMMTYRGYGGSTGRPSEAANVADAKLAFDLLVREGVPPADIIVYGESIGTGVAVQVAAARPASGLVLDAPYTSLVDVASRVYPYLPVRPFLWDRYETMRFIGRIDCPLLVVHGALDDIIPVAMGRQVHAAAKTPAALAVIPGAGHSDHHLFGSFEVVDAWIEALRRGGQ
jgi:hypothetical protein